MDTLESLVGDAELLAFTGKGGVGKTTTAAATAMRFAERGDRTLLLSTDRSPSLSDVLGIDVYGNRTSVPDVPGLDALELDFDGIADRWKAEFGEEVYSVISSFMPVDRWVIDYFAEAPGIATQFALSYLLEYYEGDTYDRIVWDTAPAGATIGLIELEEKLYSHLGEAPKFYAKLRAAINRDVSEDPSKLLDEWRQLAQDCLSMVRADTTAFVIVTNPETLAVKETARIAEKLLDRQINVGAVVANRVLEASICECDFHQDRVQMQARHLEELEEAYSQNPGLVTVPHLASEVDGIDTLASIGDQLFDGESAVLEETVAEN